MKKHNWLSILEEIAAWACPFWFTVDLDGERTSMSDNGGSTSYTYDNRGRMTQKSGPQGTLNYGYDSHGNLLTLESGTSNGANLTYTYDACNRLSTMTDGRIGGTTTYHYDADGNLQSLAYPNNVTTSYHYDTLDRLTGSAAVKGNSPLATYAYTLRADGLRSSLAESGPATSGRTDTWTMDTLNRLLTETITNASSGVNGTSTFTYDPTNRLSRSSTIAGVTSTTQTYDANDRRADEGYDANGSTTSTGGNGYSYDAEGKMTSATLVSPTTETVSLTYDGDSNLVQKAVNGATTTYLIDTNNLSGYAQIVEARTNGALTDVFNYGSTGIISQGHVPTGTTLFFGKDGSNNTRYLTDSQTGNVTDTFDYTADGIRVNETGSFPTLHQFQGEYLDTDLNLYWLRARWMNPQTGEFITMDSYEGDNTDPPSLHKYAFVQWDGGVNNYDPSGNDSISDVSQYDTSLWTWIDNKQGVPGPVNSNTATFYMRAFAPWVTFGVKGAKVGYGFAGDSRSFTTDLNASSRISSSWIFNTGTGNLVGLPNATSSPSLFTSPYISRGPITAIDSIQWQQTGLGWNFDVAGAVPLLNFFGINNPLVPEINMHLAMSMEANTTGSTLEFRGNLTGDAFPDVEIFEIYKGQATMLKEFTTNGSRDSGPLDLLPGDNHRPMGSFDVTVPQ